MLAERTLVVATIAILCSTSPVLAQTVAAGQVSYREGSVSLQPRGNGEWIKVDPGNTARIADNVWADQNSRAELLLGADIVRLGSETSLTIESASENGVELKLWLGSVIVAHRGNASRMIRIETPNLLFTFEEPGEYRLDVNAPGNETVATVWEGRGEARGGGARYFVHAGQRAELSGTDDLQVVLGPILRADEFDQWAMNRDQSLGSDESRRRAANDSTGPSPTDESASAPDAADDPELGPGGPGTVAMRCPTPWCEVVAVYPTPWLWPPWWGPYPDPWVLTASVSQPKPRTEGVIGTAAPRPVASAMARPHGERSHFQPLPLTSQAVPAKARPAEGGSSQPANPKRNPGSTDAKSHSPTTMSRQQEPGSASSGRPSTSATDQTKTTTSH